MKRKIHFVLIVADRFVKKDFGYTIPIDVPEGNQINYPDLLIEYEQIDKDPLIDAYKALDEWVNTNYPGMDYRTQYWTLEFI